MLTIYLNERITICAILWELCEALGYDENVRNLAEKAIAKYGKTNRLAVMANGNTELPDEVLWLLEHTEDDK